MLAIQEPARAFPLPSGFSVACGFPVSTARTADGLFWIAFVSLSWLIVRWLVVPTALPTAPVEMTMLLMVLYWPMRPGAALEISVRIWIIQEDTYGVTNRYQASCVADVLEFP